MLDASLSDEEARRRLKAEQARAGPTFAVWADRDAGTPERAGTLRQRVQIVKGWYKGGYGWEKIYDVALSDGRQADPKTGKIPPVGNTVNLETEVVEMIRTNLLQQAMVEAFNFKAGVLRTAMRG